MQVKFHKALSLVATCPNHRGFYKFPASGILTTSVNNASQPSKTVGDFYDVIGRIGSIFTMKVHPRRSLTVGDFYDECEHEICLSETVADGRPFL